MIGTFLAKGINDKIPVPLLSYNLIGLELAKSVSCVTRRHKYFLYN
jgi:hypothetical protein